MQAKDRYDDNTPRDDNTPIYGMSSSSDEDSDGEEGVPHTGGAKRCLSATWTPMAAGVTSMEWNQSQRLVNDQIPIDDDSIYDPLANKMPEVQLENSQWAFLLKYFKDPQFNPGLLDALEEDAPIPEILSQWVRRPMDQEILDLMPQNAQDWAVQQDKAFLSVSARLGTALGPLIQLWNEWRRIRSQLGPDDDQGDKQLIQGSCKAVEQALIGMGQVQGALLYQRRVA